MSNADSPKLRAAAIVDDGSCDVDALLAAISQQQQAAGRVVRGLLMTHPDGGEGCASPMVLLDLHTQDAYLVSQPLGAASTACRADPQGFARASQVLRRALDESPELVISNRFGGLEAEGKGFRDELLALLMADIPLLTVVATRHQQAWRDFCGGGVELPAQQEAVLAWFQQTLQAAPSQPAKV